MTSIIEYFSSLEYKPLHRLAFLAGSILVLWIIENGLPLVPMNYRKNKAKHAMVNFTFTIFHLVIHSALAVLLVLLCDWCVSNKIGLLQWVNMPVWAVIVVGVLSMDFFGGYVVHRVQHRIPLFWRMHIVHHAETNVDVTTGLRHHPLEALFRWLFFAATVVIMGTPIYVVMIAQTLLSMVTMFTHANLRLPPAADKFISYFMISPNMHKVHHHWQQPYTDSNFGTAFSIWDRMFGTYKELDPSRIKYGLDRYYNTAQDENIKELLKSPFQSFAEKVEPPAQTKTTQQTETAPVSG